MGLFTEETDMTNPTEMTPAEIDTLLSKLYEAADTKSLQHGNIARSLKKHEDAAGESQVMQEWRQTRIKDMMARLHDINAALTWIDDATAPLEAEFNARGRWSRYFLVRNSNGHVHRERSCSTCFRSTQYSWLIDLADCDEAAMVLQYGEMACTVCFPNAPTLKGWGDYVDVDKEARKAERAAKKAAKEASQVKVGRHTFKTERGAEIELVSLLVSSIHREAMGADTDLADNHRANLITMAREDRAKALDIAEALGTKRGIGEDVVLKGLEARVAAKCKRDGY